MAYGGRILETTIQAGEDLNSGCQYHAIALDDGKLANNAEEASGILINKPKSGEGLTLGYIGEQKFAAGAAITKGDKLTVATSGWFTTADSNDVAIGEAKAAVASGSIGTGLFSFPQATGAFPECFKISMAVKDLIGSGLAVDMKTMAVVTNGHDADMIAQTGANSGGTTDFLLFGKGTGRVSAVTSVGNALTAIASGYLSPTPASGDFICARALANVASGQAGNIFFSGAEFGYKPTSWAA